ncbi:MAG: acyl-CoA dehydrogenase family protein [Pseudomonadota bacterium]
MSEDMNISDMLTEQLERLLSREVNQQVLAAAEQGQFATSLWQEIADMDIASALVPEAAGGAGLSWSEIESAWRTCGRHVAPVPLGETMIAAWALGKAGLEIPQIPLAISTSIWELDGTGKLSGNDSMLAWGGQVEGIVGIAKKDDRHYVCLLRSADVNLDAVQTYERTPMARLSFSGVTPQQLSVTDAVGELGLQTHLAVLRVVQMAGALDRILALCIEYGNTRVQFGKQIGKFQAIQHMIAELAGHAAAAQVAGLYACRQIDGGTVDEATFGAAVAKTRLGSAATRATAIAHQVFGAIGVTDEHQLHYFTRRLWQWRADAGSEHSWSEYLGRRALKDGGDGLWDKLARHGR